MLWPNSNNCVVLIRPTPTSCYYASDDGIGILFQKLWFQHVWPTLRDEMKTQEVLAAALQPIFLLISQVSYDDRSNI